MRAHFARNRDAYVMLAVFFAICWLANGDSPYHYAYGY